MRVANAKGSVASAPDSRAISTLVDGVQRVLVPQIAGNDVSKPKPAQLLGRDFPLVERGDSPSQ